MKKRLAGIGLLGMFTVSAFAQPAEWGRRDRDDYFRNENRYRYEERYRPDYGYSYRTHYGRDAAIIGGSAAAGAVIGGLAGHGAGAAVGAIAGGVVGAIADHATHEHRDWR
jgi:hypothetical protein